MQLPNRDELENSFAVRFTRVNARLRHQLEDYLGYPPDISRVPESFWQEVQDEMNRELAIVLLLIWNASALLHGLDAQAAQSQAAAYAASRAATVAPQFAANTRQMLQNAAGRWAELPEPPTRGQVQTDLVTILGPTRAGRVATTETTKAQTDGGEKGIGQTIGVRAADKWMTKNDGDRVCPICRPLHAKPRTVWAAQFPQGPGDEVHPDCLLPGNLVVPFGPLGGGAKSLYVGPCIEVALGSGAKFSVTPNHPVLTSRGWTAAKFLCQGGDVISTRFPERIAESLYPDDHNRPSTIEEVFDSLVKSPFMRSAAVPHAAEDFHGDGRFMDGNVEVVDMNRLLSGGIEAAELQPAFQNGFRFGDMGAETFASFSAQHSFGNRMFPTAASVMGRCDHCGSLLPGRIAPSLDHHIGLGAGRDAGFQQLTTDGRARNSQPQRQRQLSLASPVRLKHSRNVNANEQRVCLGSQGYAAGLQLQSHQLPLDSSLSRQFTDRFSCQIAPSQITEVRQFNFRGHVYDLRCDRYRLYSCNGAIVHNCRCWIEYAVDLELPKGGRI